MEKVFFSSEDAAFCAATPGQPALLPVEGEKDDEAPDTQRSPGTTPAPERERVDGELSRDAALYLGA